MSGSFLLAIPRAHWSSAARTAWPMGGGQVDNMGVELYGCADNAY